MNARAAARIAALVLLFAFLAPIHLAAKAITGTSPWAPRFLGAAARIIGARVRVEGLPVEAHTLLISNHVSWLDILVMSAATGCAFVSKDNLGHPFVHWLADQNGTIYVRRSDVKGARNQAAAVAHALRGPKPLTLFPEGTTGPGTHLLPFRSTLLEAAALAPEDIEVRPVAIDYGDWASDICWWGDEPGTRNVLRLLGRKGRLPVLVSVLGPLSPSPDRKQLAAAARDAIADRLGFKSPVQSPIGVTR